MKFSLSVLDSWIYYPPNAFKTDDAINISHNRVHTARSKKSLGSNSNTLTSTYAVSLISFSLIEGLLLDSKNVVKQPPFMFKTVIGKPLSWYSCCHTEDHCKFMAGWIDQQTRAFACTNEIIKF